MDRVVRGRCLGIVVLLEDSSPVRKMKICVRVNWERRGSEG